MVRKMSELALQQIHEKTSAILMLVMKLRTESTGYSTEIEGLVSHKHKLEEENKRLRRIIYNNHFLLKFVNRDFLQEVIAEFEPKEWL
jgi:hypothetical protein